MQLFAQHYVYYAVYNYKVCFSHLSLKFLYLLYDSYP